MVLPDYGYIEKMRFLYYSTYKRFLNSNPARGQGGVYGSGLGTSDPELLNMQMHQGKLVVNVDSKESKRGIL